MAFGRPFRIHRLIGRAYLFTVPILFVSLLLHGVGGRAVEVWRASFCFVGSLLTVTLVSIVTPAKGVGLWIAEEALARLPAGAARYHWATFDRFYEGKELVLRLSSIDGVVSRRLD